MKIELREINRGNWYACTQLTVTDEQKEIFPVPVVGWMARAKYEDDLKELAIYHGDDIVGFCVYGIDPEDGHPWIIAIMIDKQFQRNGFGREAVKEMIRLIQEKCDCQQLFIGHRPENTVAGDLYESLGFNRTGQIMDGEVIRCFTWV